MNLFLKKPKVVLPCQKLGYCPYEYGQGSDRDIEGMPHPVKKRDPRACPIYGHICPVFMEDFGLTVEDLKIRATIHCGSVAKHQIETGEWVFQDPEQIEQIRSLMKRYDAIVVKYPQKEYPEYY